MNEIATLIMDKLKEVTDNHEGVYAERTGNRYLLHAQVAQAIMKKINVMRQHIAFVWVKNQRYWLI